MLLGAPPDMRGAPNIWIGCVHPDRLLTYPDMSFPIQMRRSYPDAPFLSRCAVPIHKQHLPSRGAEQRPAPGPDAPHLGHNRLYDQFSPASTVT